MAYEYKDTPVLSKVKIGGETYYLKDAEARDAIASILNDYLTSADKTELEDLITAEETRATGAEGDLQELIDALEAQVGTSDDEASASGSLYARIKKEIADRAAAIAQEVTDRNDAIASAINALDVTDTAVEGQYVSAVKEVDGKIEVTREALPAADQYTLVKQATPDTGDASTYYLTKNGTQVGAKINVAKDQFLKDAKFCATSADVPAGHTPPSDLQFPAILFIFTRTAGDVDTWVSVKDLVDVYTAGDGIDITGNEISVKVKANDSYIEIDDNDQIATKGIDTAIANAVAAEAEIARAAEGANAIAISDEETRAKAAEQANVTAISNEVTRAEAAEKANADDIDALEGRMATAESDIDSLETHMTTAEADIDANTAAIATEKTRAEGQEAAIRSEFAAADTTLDGKITAEATARGNADDAINAKIGAKTDAATAETVYGAINKEAADRAAADTALGARIDALDAGAFKDVTYVDASRKLQKKIGETVSDVHTFGDLADENLANLEVKGQTKAVVFTSNSVDVKEYTVADAAAATAAEVTRSDYKPAGDVTVTLKDNTFNAITSVGSLPTYTDGSFSGGKATVIDTTKFNGGAAATWTGASFTAPSLGSATTGSFAQKILVPDISATDSECLVFNYVSSNDDVTERVFSNAVTAQGDFSAGSVDFGTFDGGSAASLGDGFYTAGSDASYTAPTYVAGTLPQMASQTVAVNTAAFDGTTETGLKVTGVNYKKQVLNDSTVTKTVTVAGTVTTDDKAVTKKSV